MTPIARAALNLIDLYRRFVSPSKGFSCAHGAIHGGASCSLFADRVVRRVGFFGAIPLINRRLDRCAQTYHQSAARQVSDGDLRTLSDEKNQDQPNKNDTSPCPSTTGLECVGCCEVITVVDTCG